MDNFIGSYNHPISWQENTEVLARILPEQLALSLGIAPLGPLGDELWIGAYKGLASVDRYTLEQSLRYPFRLSLIGYSQVLRLQSQIYKHTDLKPPSLPNENLLHVLGMEKSPGSLEQQLFETQSSGQMFNEWLRDGKITPTQWSHLTSLIEYLPTKNDLQPSPINTLPAFLEIDPALKREVNSFIPLWWVNHTLFVGVSDPDQFHKVESITKNWPCRVSFLAIPGQLLAKLNRAHEGSVLFAPEIRDEQIADALLPLGKVTEAEVQAALTLNRRTGITICDALSESRPEIHYHWLETKAGLAGTTAIHERDLPGNFDQVLTSLFDILPYEICLMLKVLPLNFMNGILVIGTVSFHPGMIAILNEVSGYPIETRLMTEATILDRLAKAQVPAEAMAGFKIGIPQVTSFLEVTHLVQRDQLGRVDLPGDLSLQAYLFQLAGEGLLSEDDIAEVYAVLFETPYLSLENLKIDPNFIQQFSQSFLRENHLLPLFAYDGAIWVAISNPLQGESLEKFSKITGLKVWPFIVSKSALDNLLRQTIDQSSVDKSNPYLEKCLQYLVGKGILQKSSVPEILASVLEDDQPLDRTVISHLSNPDADVYAQFASFREVSYLSLHPEIESEKMIDPLGVEVEQKRRRDPVEWDIARKLDYDSAKRLSALPISEDENGIRVAFSDPLFDAAVRELSERLEVEIEPVITSRIELNQAIERVLGRKNIGTLLVNAGLITRNQLNDALNLAEKTNTHVGQALIHRGYITENQLYTFLSKQTGIPLFDLSRVTLSKQVAETFTPDEEWEWGVLPLSKDDKTLVLGVIDPVNQDSLTLARQKTHLEIKPVLITERDFESALEELFKDQYTAQSVSALLSRSPENSAAQVLTKTQKIWMVIFLVVLLGLAIWNLDNFLIGLNAVFTIIYISMVVYKFFLISSAIGSDLEVPISDEELEALRDDELPTYTILIPVYKEAAVLPSLLKAVEELDYPKIKLDVKVLLEQDDSETIAAFHNSNPPEYIQGLIVPTSLPKTKPKACNYGLIHAKGELLVIFDAEDQPDRDQLKKIVVAFKKSPANVICMQAKLNYFNRQQNVLTQWFSSEYSMWFDLFLPGLDAHNVPIPLGGTSNHFKKFALIEAGAWDPHNMTEDADLGIRLYKLGYRTKIVDTTTYEEANSNVKNWVRQRSRWVKGHIQTWLVHMRHPIQLIRDIGFKAFFSFQMVVGGNIFTVILNPVYWLITLSWVLFRFDFISELFPGPIHYMGAFSLYFGNFAFTYMNVAGAMGRGYYDMVKTTLLSPLYWGLMSIGGWRGFIQILTKPHYWEKTIHGLSTPEQKTNLEIADSEDPEMEEEPA
ncbi:MAG: glycosyltransferase [Anaerolineaceae bacterium]|nr:glycosyltransferase [Anaerolineaceae bacterium]